MGVFQPPDCRTWRFKFRWRGRSFNGNTWCTRKEDAERWLRQYRVSLEQRRAGLVLAAKDSPLFSDWATVYYEYTAPRLTRPDSMEVILRIVLRFWGDAPAGVALTAADPYHGLRLLDPAEDSDWLLRFEDWMAARKIGPQSRNHYRSAMSRMYRVALLPQYRKRTGVTVNPFAGIPRDATVGRTVTLTPDQVSLWLRHMPYHVRMAVAITALAPKLRKRNILQLRFGYEIDDAVRTITVHRHKTVHRTKRPLVTPIVAQLRTILLDAKARNRSMYAVEYRGGPVGTIVSGVRLAAVRAGIPYGLRTPGGATFHSLRHSMSTLLATDAQTTAAVHQAVMGHENPATTARYTHLDQTEERVALERHSARLPIAAIVMQPGRRAGRTAGPETVPLEVKREKNAKEISHS